jgi:hypothetical protein
LTKAYFRHKDLQQRENQKSLSSSNPLTKAYFRHKDLQQRENSRKGMEGREENLPEGMIGDLPFSGNLYKHRTSLTEGRCAQQKENRFQGLTDDRT